MRNFMNIVEGAADTDLPSIRIRQGETEGFNPYWKLVADPRVLSDEAAMMLIADFIDAGIHSGVYPTWELITVEPELEAVANGSAIVDAGVEIVPEINAGAEFADSDLADVASDVEQEISDIEADLEIIPDEDVITDVTDEFEVEEGFGEKAKDYVKGAAYGAALAAGVTGAITHGHEDLSVANAAVEYGDSEEYKAAEKYWADKGYDITETDEVLIDEPKTLKDYLEDDGIVDVPFDAGDDREYLEDDSEIVVSDADERDEIEVLVDAIHARGEKQESALAELKKRGLELTLDQRHQAGLV